MKDGGDSDIPPLPFPDYWLTASRRRYRHRSHLPYGLPMVKLTQKWAAVLASKPETGMGYQVVSVVKKNGSRFDQVAVVEGQITKIRGRKDILFSEDEIAEVVLTHNKWNFNAER